MDQTGALDALLQEERVFRPLPQMVIEANVNPHELEQARERADADYLAYWEDAAHELDWFKKWDKVLDDSNPPFYRWFPGAKCNIVYNALDRHIETANKNKLALIWEGEPGDQRKYTYYELYREVNRFANALRSLGLSKGDRVVIYMPLLPETLIAMLAVAKIGAVHSLIYGGFSAKILRERVRDAGARLVITADGFYRNGRVVNLKEIVNEALLGSSAECVETCVVVHRAGVDAEMHEPRDLWYEDLVRRERPESPTEVMDADDELFLLYSSGTTGKPKGIVHNPRRLPGGHLAHPQLGLRPQTHRHLLVHRRHGLDHRAQLRGLRPPGGGHDDGHVRGPPPLPPRPTASGTWWNATA